MPSEVLPAATEAATSPPWAPTPGTRIGRSPTSVAHRSELRRVGRSDDQPALAQLRSSGRRPSRRRARRAGGRRRRGPAARPMPGLLVRHTANTAPRASSGAAASVPRYGLYVAASARVALEQLTGVELGGRADVAALGVEDDRDVRVVALDVGAHRLQRRFGPLRREVGDLWLVGADEVGRGVDDRAAEPLDRIGCAGQRRRQPGRIGVEPDAQHRPDDAHAAASFAANVTGALVVRPVTVCVRRVTHNGRRADANGVHALAARYPSAAAASGLA